MEVLLLIFVLGYFAQAMGNLILVHKIKTEQKIAGLNTDTQIIFLIAIIFRLFWFRETRLTNTYFTYVELLFSLCIQVYIITLFSKYSYT